MFFKDYFLKNRNRCFTEWLFNELLLYKPIIVWHKMKLLLQMIRNLATINTFQNFLGQKVGFKNLLEKNNENMNMKEQNQTTAILVGLNKFDKK